MTDSSDIDLPSFADRVRVMGYDIERETPEQGRPVGSAISARRDLGEHVVLVVLDHVGRLRVTLTWVVGEWPAETRVGDIGFRSVDRVSREVTLTGQVTTLGEAVAVVAGLGTIEPWAAPPDAAQPASDELPPPP